jgi:hypothetical protein
MNAGQELLSQHLDACAQRIEKLKYSVEKNQSIFPLTLVGLKNLSDEQEESIDALILRYSQCVSMIQDQLFRSIAHLEQEDISDKSNRDKALLMEKLGAIQSADSFGTAAVLRNKFSHHYPEQAESRIDRLNLVIEESEFVMATFAQIASYLQRKGLLVRQ